MITLVESGRSGKPWGGSESSAAALRAPFYRR